ncbi:MAG TPA: Plug domain-containing protein, partial [Gemmatimonadaceae bacterium]|nr:Plug domain-containing protein [Gemmatimonadaceae bacterium]
MRRHEYRFVLLTAAAISGCVNTARTIPEHATESATTFTAEQIAESGFTNAWDFLRARARGYEFSEDQFGRPSRIRTRRGRSTINIAGSDMPMILIDGARLSDVGALRDLPAGAISSIDLMSGITGTAAQGTNAAAGVISI